MTLKDYREQMWQFAIYPKSGSNPLYAELGLLSEIGELAGEAKRVIRDDGGELTPERREKMIDEMGDIMWYLSALSHENKSEEFLTSFENVQNDSHENFATVNDFLICINNLPNIFYSENDDIEKFYNRLNSLITFLDISLEEILRRNIDKLQSRMDRNRIKGAGGDR